MKKSTFGIGIIIASLLIFLIPLSVSAANTGAVNNTCTGNNNVTYNSMMSQNTMQNMMKNASHYGQNMMNSIGNNGMMSQITGGNSFMGTMVQGFLGYPDIFGIENSIVKWYQGTYTTNSSPNTVSSNQVNNSSNTVNDIDHASHHK